MTPTQHAFLSASSAQRWANCTAAPHFEKQFPPSSSVYAAEGTLAHSFCELFGRQRFDKGLDSIEFEGLLEELQDDELYDPEMIRTAEFYVGYLWERALKYKAMPYVVQEVKLDLSDIIPEGFGTSDAVMIGGDNLTVIDYKHGKGVPVSAEGNMQMRLYALGALKRYAPFYKIKTVTTAIVQPRISEEVSEETITVEELRKWGEDLKPIARAAFTGEGAEFHSGDWCRFCRGRAVCKARAENYTALEDFKDIPAKNKAPAEDILRGNFLSHEKIGELLKQAEGLAHWIKDLEDYALQTILEGEEIPGYKVVEGKSNRKITDSDKVVEILEKHGFPREILYEYKLKTLTQLEKTVGKKDFGTLAGEYIVKPAGAPTLVPETDKRKPYSPAEADFKGVKA